jgi:hypothetical protein
MTTDFAANRQWREVVFACFDLNTDSHNNSFYFFLYCGSKLSKMANHKALKAPRQISPSAALTFVPNKKARLAGLVCQKIEVRKV